MCAVHVLGTRAHAPDESTQQVKTSSDEVLLPVQVIVSKKAWRILLACSYLDV